MRSNPRLPLPGGELDFAGRSRVPLLGGVRGWVYSQTDSGRIPNLATALCLFLLVPVIIDWSSSGAESASPPGISHGLKQTLTLSGSGADEGLDTRVARIVALYVPEGSAVSPFLEAGPFVSKWEGYLNLKINDYFVFSAQGRGKLMVRINDERVLETEGPDLGSVKSGEIDMKKGPNRIQVTYESPKNGDSEFRLYWWNPLQPVEPVSPESFTHDLDDSDLARGLNRRTGRRLFAEGRCIRCHSPDDGQSIRSGGMPELAYDSPVLTEIGGWLKRDWIAEWLANPSSTRSQARMPSMLYGDPDTIASNAADLAAFLSAQTASKTASPEEPGLFGEGDSVEKGKEVFHALGCFTCHLLPGDEMVENDDRLSLSHVKVKWKPEGLADFLRDPTRRYKWTRMPDFKLTEDEAVSLTSFILSRCEDTRSEPSQLEGDVVRGRRLVATIGCINCHEINGVRSETANPSLTSIANASGLEGCIAETSSERNYPEYSFTATERSALVRFLAEDRDSLDRHTWGEFANRQFANLRCGSCHTRDQQHDLWSNLIAAGVVPDKAAPIEEADDLIDDFGDDFGDGDVDSSVSSGGVNIHLIRPPLTWIGEKLHADWMEKFIGGTLEYKPRKQIPARMPGYPAFARGLAKGFAADHGFNTLRPAEPELNPDLAEIGQRFIQMDKFGCWSCHAMGEKGALSGASAEAINFQYVPDRIRRHYFERFMQNPKRVLPGTMMPLFVGDDGLTPFSDTFGGDARKQFDAIWHFMRTLDD